MFKKRKEQNRSLDPVRKVCDKMHDRSLYSGQIGVFAHGEEPHGDGAGAGSPRVSVSVFSFSLFVLVLFLIVFFFVGR